MLEFLMRGTHAEKKGVQDSCSPINIINFTLLNTIKILHIQ
jgi:hypothetical protein